MHSTVSHLRFYKYCTRRRPSRYKTSSSRPDSRPRATGLCVSSPMTKTEQPLGHKGCAALPAGSRPSLYSLSFFFPRALPVAATAAMRAHRRSSLMCCTYIRKVYMCVRVQTRYCSRRCFLYTRRAVYIRCRSPFALLLRLVTECRERLRALAVCVIGHAARAYLAPGATLSLFPMCIYRRLHFHLSLSSSI